MGREGEWLGAACQQAVAVALLFSISVSRLPWAHAVCLLQAHTVAGCALAPAVHDRVHEGDKECSIACCPAAAAGPDAEHAASRVHSTCFKHKHVHVKGRSSSFLVGVGVESVDVLRGWRVPQVPQRCEAADSTASSGDSAQQHITCLLILGTASATERPLLAAPCMLS